MNFEHAKKIGRIPLPTIHVLNQGSIWQHRCWPYPCHTLGNEFKYELKAFGSLRLDSMYNTHLVLQKLAHFAPVAPHIIITLCPRIVPRTSSAKPGRIVCCRGSAFFDFLIMCHSKKCWHQLILKQKNRSVKIAWILSRRCRSWWIPTCAPPP